MRQYILGIGFDPVTLDTAVFRVLEAMKVRDGGYICTPNPEIVMLAQKDTALQKAIAGATLVLPDGAGIIWAAKRLGLMLPRRVAGYDLLMAVLAQMRGSVYILGGRPGVAQRAAENISARFPGVSIAGFHDGFYTDEAAVLADIRRAGPDLLLVCLGAPRQELWMAAHRGEVGGALMAGLGGSVDVLAGDVSRAPAAWRDRGLEWLYRLLRQPWRLRRQLRLPLFAARVSKQRNKQ